MQNLLRAPKQFEVTIIDDELEHGPTKVTTDTKENAVRLTLNKYKSNGVDFSTKALCRIKEACFAEESVSNQ